MSDQIEAVVRIEAEIHGSKQQEGESGLRLEYGDSTRWPDLFVQTLFHVLNS